MTRPQVQDARQIARLVPHASPVSTRMTPGTLTSHGNSQGMIADAPEARPFSFARPSFLPADLGARIISAARAAASLHVSRNRSIPADASSEGRAR